MADENKKPLNLDEIFGQARAVKIIWKEKEYELLRMEAIGPKEAVKFNKMRAMVARLQDAGDGLTDEQAEEVETFYDKMLNVLCQDLPLDTLEFGHKVRILSYYIEQTSEKKK